MRKLLIGLSILLLLAAFLPARREADVFRLHVVANSDLAEDQRQKLSVRDAILERFGDEIGRCGSVDSAMLYCARHSDEINAFIKEMLPGERVGVWVGFRDFPTRQYGQTTYPAGNYPALMVELGRAEGANWWCVMFPPLCLANQSGHQEEEVKVTSLFLKWWRKWRMRQLLKEETG